MNKFLKIAVLAAIAPLAGFAEDIVSANTFGVMKVVAKKQMLALPVPFGGASAAYDATKGEKGENVSVNTNITLRYMLQMSSLPLGTFAHIYNSTEKKYDVYKLVSTNSGNDWQPQLQRYYDENGTINYESTSTASKEIPTGTGFFLEFPSAPDPVNGQIVYLYGQELTGDAPETVVPANSTALVCPPQTACTVNCEVSVTEPTATTLDGKGNIATVGDSITVVNGLDASASTNPTRTYYYVGGAWKYYSNSFADIANPWKADGPITVPAGCAMWYTNKSTEARKTVSWTQAAN